MRASIIGSWFLITACGGDVRGKNDSQRTGPEAEGGASGNSATEAGSAGAGGDSVTSCPEHCFDGTKNDAETDVDCGGDCNPCPPAASCVAGDCTPPAVCACGLCYPPGEVPSCDVEPPGEQRCE